MQNHYYGLTAAIACFGREKLDPTHIKFIGPLSASVLDRLSVRKKASSAVCFGPQSAFVLGQPFSSYNVWFYELFYVNNDALERFVQSSVSKQCNCFY